MSKVANQQRKFYNFLKKHELARTSFTQKQISDATGYSLKGTVRAKLSRNEWDKVLARKSENRYISKPVSHLSLQEFMARLSTKRGIGTVNKGPISQSERLLKQAKDNYTLSLEIYNRPSLENRIQAFTLIHCAAWEHFFKALISSKKGKDAIFKSKKSGRTKGLEECAKELLGQNSKVFRNLKLIIDLRNTSTHHILPELSAAYSPIFQASVINFIKLWKKEVSEPLLPESSLGLMSLTTGETEIKWEAVKTKYGPDLVKEIESTINAVIQEIEDVKDNEFAISFAHTLRFAKEGEEDFTIRQLIDGEKLVVHKNAPDHSNELLSKMVIEKVNERLVDELSDGDLKLLFPNSKTSPPSMNSNDWSAISTDQKWKSGNNKFHREHGVINRSTYTIECVHWIVQKLKDEPDYLPRVKAKYNKSRKKK
ncbi:DUF3644 domain-containing protein [Ulvibacterium sp.]|uniref:DUF3644 domain-containing protein n=1 Tax=Ulvibacterium sp. TaxID=2665914 RepID=UPI003BAC5FA0